MIDFDRIAKAKTDILNVYEQIDTLVKSGKEDFLKDPKSPLALKYLLIEAVEAITDICQHLLAKFRGIACEGYIDCILKTGKEEIITVSLTNNVADSRTSETISFTGIGI